MPTTTINLTGQALSKTDDTNVTLTLTGTPLTALLKTVGITVGWTGTLAATRGGTGLSALGTAGQLLKVNAGGTALEYFTPSYGTGTVTSFAFTDSTGITSTVLNSTTTPTLSLSLTSAAVGLGNVENTALSTWAGSANITTLGTIGIGTWNAGQITSTTAFTAPALGGVGITCLSTFANTLNLNQSYFAGGFLGIKTDNFNEAAGVGYGLSGTFEASGSGTLSFMIGVEGGVVNSGSGAQPFATGVGSIIENTGAGSITVGYNFKVSDNQAVTKYGFFNDVAGVTNKFLSLDLGTASTVDGTLVLYNSANAFTTTLKTGVTGASYTLTLPTSDGASGEFLQTNGSGVLTWAAAGGGITINSTAISGGGANRFLFENSSNQVSEVAKDFYFQTASPFAHVIASGRSGTISGVNASVFGYNAAYSLTSGTNNTAVGFNALYAVTTTNYSTAIGASALENSTGASNTAVGYYSQGIASGAGANNTSIGDNSLRGRTSGNRNVALGAESLFTLTTGSYNVAIGFEACYTGNLSGTIGIGYFANPTASNTGVLGSGEAESRIDNWFLNGVVYAAPYSTVINGCGGSGTNIAGASLTIAGGKGTGTGAGGNIVFQTSTVGASGTTLQTLATRFTIEKLRVTAAVPIKLMGYTVATLPAAPSVGDTAYCTDLLTPTFFTVAVGGGAVTGMVFYDGTIWKT